MFTNWITRLLHWLAGTRLVAFTIAIVVVAVWVSFFMHTEPAIRLAGLCLQLLGIAAAALGIRDTRLRFNKPSFLQSLRSWATSCPRFNPKVHHTLGSNVRLIARSGSGAATQWHRVKTDATLEERMDALEANLKGVEDRLRSAEGAMFTNTRDKSKLQEELKMLDTQFEKLRHKMETTLTDGLHLAAVGLFWLVVGVVLSTAPCELLAWSLTFSARY